MEPIKIIDYRQFKIDIVWNEYFNTDNLNDDDDIFLLYYHRQFWVTKKGYEKSPTNEEIKNWAKEFYYIPVYAYIHSGVSLSLGNENYPFDCKWDTSNCGCILIKKDGSDSKEKRQKAAQALIDEWNDVLSGQVYGYEVYFNDELIDSCWGFIGDYEKSGIIEEAQGIVDNMIKNNQQKYAKQLQLNL
jgi:hypothetical protein